MVKIENHCCDCAVPGYPCIGSACPLRRVEVHYCDRCGEQIDGDSYDDCGTELCLTCREDLYD